jgi:GrpB-like predicted nucleotidyltransferase (UPF0157 family)
VPYDSEWPAQFEMIRSRLAPYFADGLAAMEQVGSTAVPGMAAKPVIDLELVVGTAPDVPVVIERLGQLGYIHRGDLGIPGREAFDAPVDLPYHHLYVVVDGSKPHQDHMVLRDFLRQNRDAAAQYSAHKFALAHLITAESRQAYLEAKASVVEEVLARAREQLSP